MVKTSPYVVRDRKLHRESLSYRNDVMDSVKCLNSLGCIKG